MKNTKPMMLLALLPLLSLSPAWSQPRRGDGPPMNGGGRMRNSPKRQLSRWLDGLQRLDADSKTKLNKAQAKKISAALAPWRSRKTMTDDQAKALLTSLTQVLTVPQKDALNADRPFGRRGGRDDGREGRGPGKRDRGPRGFGGRGPGDDGPGDDGPHGRGDFGGPRPEGRPPRDGGPQRGGMGGERPTESQMKAMRRYMTDNNPLASPRLSPGFSSLPTRMQDRMLERFRDSDTFFKSMSQRAR